MSCKTSLIVLLPAKIALYASLAKGVATLVTADHLASVGTPPTYGQMSLYHLRHESIER